MNEFHTTAARDDSLVNEILPPFVLGTVLLAVTLLPLVLLFDKTDGWGWLYPLTLLVAALSANKASQLGWKQLAGWLLGGAFGLLPVLTVPVIGVSGNPLVYLA